jgi:ferredoxin
MIGVSLPYLQPPENLDLSTEAVSEIVPELCIGCGACVKSCRDGAVDAIKLTEVWPVWTPKSVSGVFCVHTCAPWKVPSRSQRGIALNDLD